MKLSFDRIILVISLSILLISYIECIGFSFPLIRSTIGTSKNLFEKLKNSICTNLFPKKANNIISNSLNIELIKQIGLSSLCVLLGYSVLCEDRDRNLSPFDPQTIIRNGPFFQVRLGILNFVPDIYLYVSSNHALI